MKKISLSILLLVVSCASFAFVRDTHGNNSQDGQDDRAAGCTISNNAITLQFNNVKALVETGGILWSVRSPISAGYEVPKTDNFDGAKVIYSGALWMGGLDANGQLRLAANKFANDGSDFWAGPLSTFGGSQGNYDPSIPQGSDLNVIRPFGDANIDGNECAKYDEVF